MLIGAGGIARDGHLPAYRKAGFPVAGVYDLDPARSRALADRFGIPAVHASLAEAVRQPGCAFDLATPPGAFEEILAALPRGATVLVQKPFGLDLEQATRLLALCRERRLTAAVNFQLRFAPMMLAVRDALSRRLLGELVEVELGVNVATPWHRFAFLKDSQRVEITAHSIHYLDLLRSLLGTPRGVLARTLGHPSTALAQTRTAAILDYGPRLRCVLSLNHHHDFGRRFQDALLRFEGDEGALVVRLGLLLDYPGGAADELWLCRKGGEWAQVPLRGAWFPDGFAGTMSNLQRFAAGEDAQLCTAVEDAWHTMALVEACYRSSAAPGTPVPGSPFAPSAGRASCALSGGAACALAGRVPRGVAPTEHREGAMDHRERFHATIHHQPVDRPASWLGLPVPSAEPALLRHFGVGSMDALRERIDDDVYPIEVPYHDPPSNHIACAFRFAKRSHDDKPDERTLTAPGFFEDYSDPADVERFAWPDPAEHLDREEARRRAQAAPADRIRMGIMWSAHFQDACSAFGMEQALMVMLTQPEMFRAVIDRITRFYLRAGELFYEATRGHLDAVLIGNDFGSQTGLMLDPDSIREHVFPFTRQLIAQAKGHGLTVIHHSCGSVFPIVGDLAALGADVIHPIQALAKDMDAPNLARSFGGKVAFCGGVDAQNLLVNGAPEEVRAKVRELKETFPTGLVISPSHEAILPDIPPANVEALFDAVK